MGGFKRMHWLVKHEITHHTDYPALLDLAKLLGCENFGKLKIGIMQLYQNVMSNLHVSASS